MNLFIIFLVIFGLYLSVEGFRIVFVRSYFKKLTEEGLWKDGNEIMGKKQNFYYSKLRGIGMLFSGVIALLIAVVMIYEQF